MQFNIWIAFLRHYRAMLCIAQTMVSQYVCLSHANIVSKRLNISPNVFYQRFSGNHTILEFFDTKRYGNIPTQNP